MATLVIAWHHIPSDARNTETTAGSISKEEDVAALVEPEAEHRQLQIWHADSNLLLYRSPWGAR